MRLLYLDAQGLTALRTLRNGLSREAHFPATEDGIAQFAQYVTAHRRSVFRLLTDLADESYLHASLPRLSGADRADLLARKLAQAFPGSDYTAAASLGITRTPGTRAEENLIYLGLTRPDALAPWVGALEHAQVALASIHTLAQTAPRWHTALPAKTLLLAPTRSGLRLIFLDRGTLRFSRLAPLPDRTEDWLAEADKTRQYLVRERLLDWGERLCVTLITDSTNSTNSTNSTDTPAPAALATQELRTLPPTALAQSLKLQHPATPGIEHIALWSLAQHPPRVQLAPQAARASHHLRRARLGCYALTALIALGCGAHLATVVQETHRLETAVLNMPVLLPPPSKPAAPNTPPIKSLRALSATFARLDQASLSPRALLEPVSHVLTAQTDIELDRIDWRMSTQTTSSTTRPIEELTLTGRALSPQADPRAQIDAVSRLVTELQKTPTLDVTLSRLPIDLSPNHTLRNPDANPAGAFELKLTRPR